MKYIPTAGIFISFWIIFGGVGSYINFPTPQNVMAISFGLFIMSLCLQTKNFESLEAKIQKQEDHLVNIFNNIFSTVQIHREAIQTLFDRSKHEIK